MDKRTPILAGQRFGKLSVVGAGEPYVNPNSGKKAARILCLCDCGNHTTVMPSDLRRAFTKSCGCSQGRQSVEHGHSRRSRRSPEYSVWASMLTRCTNPNAKSYPLYGGRGVSVCDRWLTFENFLADMGKRPTGMTLDRKDNSGNYEPGNCRWATAKQQAANSRRARPLTFQGKTMLLTEWARLIGVSYQCISYRLAKGWSVEEVLTHYFGHGNLIASTNQRGTV